MNTLGINATFHDSSACLVQDGVLLAAAEEERFTHIKHGKRPIPFSAYELPFHAIAYCLTEGGIDLPDVDHIAYSFDPYVLLKEYKGKEKISLPLEPSKFKDESEWESVWDPLFLSSIVNAPRHLTGGVPLHLKHKWKDAKNASFQWHFVGHHFSHAASAFYPSPFDEAAIMTVDGRGEKETTTYYLGNGNNMSLLGHVDYPDSLGILYERVTEYLGFLHSSDEYKVMALASYGKPEYLSEFRSIVKSNGDGSYSTRAVDFSKLFGQPREKGSPMEKKHYDIAYSLQMVLEENLLRIIHWLYEKTGSDNLCMAGGVALNCVANAVIRDKGPFKNIWIQPAAGDAGTAVGAALHIDSKHRKPVKRTYRMDHVFLGPSFTDEEIEEFLQWTKVPYRKLKIKAKETAIILANDKVIGWFQGRMEFGPRALGSRSILASPIHASMQNRLNEIKDREDFRPVAPVVLEEEAPNWFENAGYSPFMLFVYNVRDEKKDKIPAVRHVDGTARIQTINRMQNADYYDLIKEFSKITGVPVLVNTSFNTRGEPIVCTPRDAVESFWTSPLDALVIGSYVLEKQHV